MLETIIKKLLERDIETELEVVRDGFTYYMEARAANLRRRGANGLLAAAVA
jgi:hypothetical protein